MTKLFTSLILTSLVLAGCAFGTSNNAQNQNVNTSINTNSDDQVSTSTDEIDTSEWKTYRNEELGISFEYDAFDKYSGKPHIIYQEEDRINLRVKGDNFGHLITVFNINDNIEPSEYLRRVHMQNVDESCEIKIINSEEAEGIEIEESYFILHIMSPTKAFYDDPCGDYGEVNAVAYFLHNKNVPTKIIWINLGQDTSLEHYQDFMSSIKIFK